MSIVDSLIHSLGGLTPAELDAKVAGMQANVERAFDAKLGTALERAGAQELMTSMGGATTGTTPGADIAGYAEVDKQLRSMVMTPWVYKAVDMLAKSVATTSLFVKRGAAPDGEALPGHPIVKLLSKPNPQQTASEFKTAIVRSHRLTGTAFIMKVLDGAGRPAELWPIRPDYVTIEPDKNDYIKGYWVQAGYNRIWLWPDEVICWKEPNPFNDYWGLSPIQALAYTIESDAGARRYTDSFYRNQARLAGALVADQVLPKGEVDRLKNLYQTEYKGPQNAWKMAFLFGGLKYVPFGVSQADMQIIETLKLNKEDILTAAYGIPMGLVSENATEANALAAYNTYANWTLYPLLVSLCEKLTTELAWAWGEDVYIEAQDVRPQDKAGKLSLLQAIQQGTVSPDGMRTPIATVNEIRKEWMEAGPIEEIDAALKFPEEEEEPEPEPQEQPAQLQPAADEAEDDQEDDPDDNGNGCRQPARRSLPYRAFGQGALAGVMAGDLSRLPKPLRDDVVLQPAGGVHRHIDPKAQEQLDWWKQAQLFEMKRQGWLSPADILVRTPDLDHLTRSVITDLLAGAETEADVEAAFREALDGEEAYP